MIAQWDHPYMLEWLAKASRDGGGFVSSIARAGLVADHQNYPLLQPLLETLRKKYPQYEPSEAVKAELAPEVEGWSAARSVTED
jgi:hypothetical protein